MSEGAIGDFAEKKIKDLIELIDNNPIANIEEIKKRIEMIGDKFLKSKLTSRFIKKLDNHNKILVLEEEIARLKKEEGKMNDKNS